MAGKDARRGLGAFAFVLAVDPDQFSGDGVKTDQIAASSGGDVKPALDQQRCAFPVCFHARAEMRGIQAPESTCDVAQGGVLLALPALAQPDDDADTKAQAARLAADP